MLQKKNSIIYLFENLQDLSLSISALFAVHRVWVLKQLGWLSKTKMSSGDLNTGLGQYSNGAVSECHKNIGQVLGLFTCFWCHFVQILIWWLNGIWIPDLCKSGVWVLGSPLYLSRTTWNSLLWQSKFVSRRNLNNWLIWFKITYLCQLFMDLISLYSDPRQFRTCK